MVRKQDIALALLGIEGINHAEVARDLFNTSRGSAKAKLSNRFKGITPRSDHEADKIIKYYERLSGKISVNLAAGAQIVTPDLVEHETK